MNTQHQDRNHRSPSTLERWLVALGHAGSPWHALTGSPLWWTRMHGGRR